MNPLHSSETVSSDRLADPRVAAALAEYQNACDSGQAPDIAEFAAGYAEIADELVGCLRALEFVQAAMPRKPAPRPPAPPAPDQVIGDYRILRELGRGGMGVVYEAEQISLMRRVALKVLPSVAALDERSLQRFRHEAQAAATLQHPHIVSVYAVGEDHGVHFFAMQLVNGRSLADVIKELRSQPGTKPTADPGSTVTSAGAHSTDGRARPLPPQPAAELAASHERFAAPDYYRDAARMIRQAAEALQHAHECGVVHRDIKPGNLLRDAQGDLWVADFGLAKLPGSDLTGTVDFMGTLRYMSPEQASGRAISLDGRSDVYSLGATLYELLTLEPAFTAFDRQALLKRVLEDEPAPPRRLNRGIPVDLETITLKAMAKEPADRYESAHAFAEDLRRFLEDRPIEAKPPTVGQRLNKWARRNRVLVGVTSGVVSLALVAGLIGSVFAIQAIDNKRVEAENALGRENVALNQANDALRKETDANAKISQLLVAEKEARTNERKTVYLHSVALAHREWLAGNVEQALALLAACPVEQRHWEWHYLSQLARSELRVLPGDSMVQDLAVTGDASRVFSISTSGVRGWTVPFGVETPVSSARVGRTHNALAVLPDGSSLFTHAQSLRLVRFAQRNDGTGLPPVNVSKMLHAWNPDNGLASRTFSAHKQAINSAVASPDGLHVATGGEDAWVYVWDTRTGKEKWSRRFFAPIDALAYAPDGRSIAVLHSGSGLELWDPEADSHRSVMTGNLANLNVKELGGGFDTRKLQTSCISFSPDGQSIAVGTSHGTILVLDTRKESPSRKIIASEMPIRKIAHDASGRVIFALSSHEKVIRGWDAISGREVATYRGHTDDPRCLRCAADGTLLFSGGEDGAVRMWDLTTPQESHWLGMHPFTDTMPQQYRTHQVRFSADGALLSTCGADRTLVWETKTGFLKAEIKGGAGSPMVAAGFGDDNRMLYRVQNDLFAQRSLSDGKETVPFVYPRPILADKAKVPVLVNLGAVNPEQWRAERAQVSRNGAVAVLRFNTGGVSVLDPRTGAVTQSLGAKLPGNAFSVAVSDDGKLAATCWMHAAKTYELHLWNVSSGEIVWSAKLAHATPNLAFSADGAKLAVGANGGEVLLFDTVTGKSLRRFTLPQQERVPVAVSPDGLRLAAGVGRAGDPTGAVRLWDVASGQELLSLALDSPASALDFSPDGKTLAAVSLEGTVCLFRSAESSLQDKLVWRNNRLSQWHDKLGRQAEAAYRTWTAAWHYEQALDRYRGDRDMLGKIARLKVTAKSAGWLNPVLATPHEATLSARSMLQATQLATQYAEAGNTKAYRRFCEQLIAETLADGNLTRLSQVILLATIAPGGQGDYAPLLKHFSLRAPNESSAMRMHLARGAILFRSGDFLAARSELLECEKNDPAAHAHALSWLLLALCEKNLGEPTSAQQWLKKADAWHLAKFVNRTPGEKSVESIVALPFPVLRREVAVTPWRQSAAGELEKHLTLGGVKLAFELAAKRLEANDPEGYQRVCKRMLELLDEAKAPSPFTASLVYRLCTLSPGGHSDYAALEAECRKRTAAYKVEYARLYVPGTILYRAGKHEAALQALLEAEKTDPESVSHAPAWLFLAMACHKLGRTDEAAKWLAKADAWYAKETTNRPATAKQLDFQLAIPFPILRREAFLLIRGKQ